MPYLGEVKNCFKCANLGASEDGYICDKGFQNFRGSRGTRTIWTGELALICPLYEEREPIGRIEAPAAAMATSADT